MGQSKKLKNLHSILKDKVKIIKSTFTITNPTTTTTIQIAVLRATTRSTHSPPPDHRISTLLSAATTTRHSASAITSAIIHRLHHHHQPNAYVTLKSLITLHSIIAGGSFHHPFRPTATTADHHYLNLSKFIDNTDAQSREFSLWAQWYARFLETNLSISKILGCSISAKSEFDKKRENVKYSLFMDLFKEIESLVSMIEEICRAPRSLHCQTNDIIYEVVRRVGEDYRMTQYHTMIRLTELSTRINSLSTNELTELTRYLERLEGCKDRLTELFVNRRRNESFWELVTELLAKLVRLKEDREFKSVSRGMIEYNTEATQMKKQLRMIEYNTEATQMKKQLQMIEYNTEATQMKKQLRMMEYNTESTQLKKQLSASSRPLGLLPLGDGNHWLTFSMANA